MNHSLTRQLGALTGNLVSTPSLAAQLIATAVHQARNPLTGLSTQLQLLERQAGDDSKLQETLKTLHKEVERAAGALRELASLAPEPVAVAGICRIDEVLADVCKCRSLKSGGTKATKVFGDRATLQAVVGYLLDLVNPSGKGAVKCCLVTEGAHVKVVVEVSPAVRTLQMDCLGITTCRRALKEYQGDLSVDNQPEGLTTIAIKLPSAQGIHDQ